MSARTADRREPRKEKLAHPVHSLNEQPNVILDLIFSYLSLFDLSDDVFPVSRRLAAHLRCRSFAVHNNVKFHLDNPREMKIFLFLIHHWSLFSLDLRFQFTLRPSAESVDFLKLDMGQECPRLEKAKFHLNTYNFGTNQEFYNSVETFISSFAGCRFLRLFEYLGPAVPSLGRLKQLEHLSLNVGQALPDIPFILRELSQLRAINISCYHFPLDYWRILQSFPALEEIQLVDFPPGTIEELIKMPALKILSISLCDNFEISSIWGKFKTLKCLIIGAGFLTEKLSILPEIRSLKELQLTDDYIPMPPWQELLRFLSLNLQLESLIVHVPSSRVLYQPDHLLQLIKLLDIHQNIKKLQALRTDNDLDAFSRRSKNSVYSRCLTDRFFFRSPAHRQEFIDSLRNLAELKMNDEASISTIETRSKKRQRLDVESKEN